MAPGSNSITSNSSSTSKGEQPSSLILSTDYFLAGIMDGDGHINKIPQISICFHENDYGVACSLNGLIGNGTISKVKNKKAYTLIISHPSVDRLLRKPSGLEKISHLIHDKLHLESKPTQYNTRLRCLPNFTETGKPKQNILKNGWFSGFFQSDVSFQIKIVSRPLKALPEIRLVIQIDQKEKKILELIKEVFGGSLGLRKSQNTYYWSSVSFRSAEKICTYFDNYPSVCLLRKPLMGLKQLQYILRREVCLKLKQRFQCQAEGVAWIRKKKDELSLLKR